MEQDLDRSEAATPFKLLKARERGQAARSVDAIAAGVFLAAMVFASWHGGHAIERLFEICRGSLQVAGDPTAAGLAAGAAAVEAVLLLLPFLLAVAGSAVLLSLVQTGVMFSAEPLKFDFSRLDPAQGLRRLASMRNLFDTARAGVKLLVLGAFAAWVLRESLPRFIAGQGLPAQGTLRLLVDSATSMGLKIATLLALLSAVDFIYTRSEFARQMRMSRRELKDEFRHREGDPRIRSRLRELRLELLKRSRALRATGTADVVLANPTHYAVALRYAHGEMDVPVLVAKGAGQLAAAMREIARRHGVPVVRQPALARSLFRDMDIDGRLPAEFHAQVARIIVWVFALRAQRRAEGAQ